MKKHKSKGNKQAHKENRIWIPSRLFAYNA